MNDSWPLVPVSRVAHHGGAGDCRWLMLHDCVKLISQKAGNNRDSISFLPSPARTPGRRQKGKVSDLEIPTLLSRAAPKSRWEKGHAEEQQAHQEKA